MNDTERLVHELRQWVTWLQRRAAYQPANLINTLQRVIDHLEATCVNTQDSTETPAPSPPASPN